MTPAERDDLVRRAAAAIAAPAPVVAKQCFDRIMEEMNEAPELAARLYEAMRGPPLPGPAWLALRGWFYAFVSKARDPGALRHLPFGEDALACEAAAVAVDARDAGSELVARLEGPWPFFGVAAALFAGARAHDALHAHYLRCDRLLQRRIALSIALLADPNDAAWFKSCPGDGEFANAKRMYLALTGKKTSARVDAIDKIARAISHDAFYGTLVGLCRLLEDETPDVVEHAALALLVHAKQRHSLSTHHALFLRSANRAVLRGVTSEARAAIEAVHRTIPRAGALVAGPIVARTLAPTPQVKANDDLVRQILARPEDDTLRLVLADRLLERGDPRGEFIQIQCALGRAVEGAKAVPAVLEPRLESNAYYLAWNDRAFFTHLDPPNRADLEARESALLRKHAREWLAPIRAFIRSWAWRRGFLDFVRGPTSSLLDGIEPIMAAHPARILLEKIDRAATDRLSVASLAGVRMLGASGATATTVRAFLGENLAELDTLLFASSPLRDDGVVQLAEASHLHGLRRLLLPVVEMGDRGLLALAASPLLANLEELHIGDAHFGGMALERLVRDPTPPKLKRVFLGRQRLDILRS